MTSHAMVPYPGIVDRLKYHHNHPQLKTMIEKALGRDSDPSNIFQIKAEIARLAKRAIRPFRVHDYIPDLDPEPYEASDMTQFVNGSVIEEFENALSKYNGEYTVGVEEHMEKFTRNNREKIKHSDVMSSVDILSIDVSEKAYRKEERMHLGIKVDIYNIGSETEKEDPLKKIKKGNLSPSLGVTQNISEGGLRIKTTTPPKIGNLHYIRFIGFEEDFVVNQPYITYECLAGEKLDRKTENGLAVYSWAMKKVDHPRHSEFDTFIKRLIKVNRSRYRVDMDNVERSVTNNIAEQFFTNRQEEITFFVKDNANPIVSYGSSPGDNILSLFDSSSKKNMLLSAALKDNIFHLKPGESKIWAVIIQKNGAVFSCIANGNDTSKAFLQYVQDRHDGHIFNITANKPDMSSAFIAHCLPEKTTASKKADRLRKGTDYYSPRVRELISQIEKAITVKMLDKSCTRMIIPLCEKKILTSLHEEFKKYAVQTSNERVKHIRAQTSDFRKEDRFVLETSVTVSNNGLSLNGKLKDISEKGACVLLEDNNIIGDLENQNVRIYFDDLKRFEEASNSAYYKIVHHRGLIIRLEMLPKSNDFVSLFLEHNHSQLEPVHNSEEMPGMQGLERALRNLHNTVHTHVKTLLSYFQGYPISTHAHINESTKGDSFTTSNAPFENNLTIKGALLDLKFQEHVQRKIKTVTKEAPFERAFVFIGYEPKKDNIKLVRIFDQETPAEPQMIYNLKKQIQKKGMRVEVYQVDLTRKSKVFDRYYREELDYINSMAIHRSEIFYDMIKNTVGITCWSNIDHAVNLFE
jgi:hypothetical protein